MFDFSKSGRSNSLAHVEGEYSYGALGLSKFSIKMDLQAPSDPKSDFSNIFLYFLEDPEGVP